MLGQHDLRCGTLPNLPDNLVLILLAPETLDGVDPLNTLLLVLLCLEVEFPRIWIEEAQLKWMIRRGIFHLNWRQCKDVGIPDAVADLSWLTGALLSTKSNLHVISLHHLELFEGAWLGHDGAFWAENLLEVLLFFVQIHRGWLDFRLLKSNVLTSSFEVGFWWHALLLDQSVNLNLSCSINTWSYESWRLSTTVHRVRRLKICALELKIKFFGNLLHFIVIVDCKIF